jgi:hypothetical protein
VSRAVPLREHPDVLRFQRELVVRERWAVAGTHYLLEPRGGSGTKPLVRAT